MQEFKKRLAFICAMIYNIKEKDIKYATIS